MEGVCAICGAEGRVVRHHISYADNVIVLLCYGCHKRLHSNPDFYPDYNAIDLPTSKRISIDGNAHKILERHKEEMFTHGIEGADFSDAIRDMNRKMRGKEWDKTSSPSDVVE